MTMHFSKPSNVTYFFYTSITPLSRTNIIAQEKGKRPAHSPTVICNSSIHEVTSTDQTGNIHMDNNYSEVNSSNKRVIVAQGHDMRLRH